MFLTKAVLSNFRNIRDASLCFSEKINCISGSNGAGKTNILDAVYYLSMTKSFFSSSDQYVYTFGSEGAALCGFYRMDGGQEEKISVSVSKNGDKSVRRGAKAYERFSEHIGLLPVVMVSPADSALINDSGEERRKYMNFILSQTDREYLRHIQAYNQMLVQRNRLLKDSAPSVDLLDIFAERMEPHAAYIFEARKNLCTRLEPMMREFCTKLSAGTEKVSLEYRSDLGEAPLSEILKRDAQKERVLRFTTAGIQRDDIFFSIDGHPIKKCGSQGQQKSFLLSMKLAQFHFIKQVYRETPILLLDDVFDKLDMERVGALLELVSSLDFGQIFITDCNKVRLGEVAAKLNAPCRNFYVEDGTVSEI